MIRLTESLQLAKTKFKTRKLRNTLSAITISLGIILILVALFGTTGVVKLGGQAFKDTNSSRFFLRDSGTLPDFSKIEVGEVSARPRSDLADVKTVDDYRKKVSGDVKAIFEEYSSTVGNFQLAGISDSEFQVPLMASDELFVKDYLYKDLSFSDSYEGKIPVVIPRDQIYKYENKTIPSKSKEKYETTAQLLQKYAGKTFKLRQLHPKTGEKKELSTEFVVVGFSSPSLFMYSPLDSSILVPTWAITKNDEMKATFDGADKHIIVEVNDKKSQESFYKTNIEKRDIMPILGKVEALNEPVSVIRKVALAIGGFMLAISSLFVLSTLSKIVADSKREIGVFRAVGGQRKDIRKIFFSYTFLLVTLGFLVGFAIAVLFTMFASVRWGNDFFYAVAQFATNVTLTKPTFVLLSIPWLQVAALYAFVLLVGFLAAFIPVFRASRLDPIKALREE